MRTRPRSAATPSRSNGRADQDASRISPKSIERSGSLSMTRDGRSSAARRHCSRNSPRSSKASAAPADSVLPSRSLLITARSGTPFPAIRHFVQRTSPAWSLRPTPALFDARNPHSDLGSLEGVIGMTFGQSTQANTARTVNVGDGERIPSIALGAGMLTFGLLRGSRAGWGLAIAGAGLAYRGLVYRALGIDRAGETRGNLGVK